jgi:hypothetical protein
MTLTLQDGHTLQVRADRPLPTGTQVTVQIQPDGQAQIIDLTLPTGSERAAILQRLGQEWPVLKQALNLLRQNRPAAARSAEATLPKPDTLLPGLVRMAQALATQSAERLLTDETVQLLKTFGVDLTPDLTSLNQLQQRSETPDGWRALLFPYVEREGEDPRQGGFFWRNQEAEEEGQPGKTRFIVQLHLSQLGDVQLDGLLNEHHINLKLRLREDPGNNFATDLQRLVQKTLAAYGLEGGITLEAKVTFPIDPLAEMQHNAGHMNLTA